MSLRLYEALKEKYETTKPIRGRAVDVRPWGDRRRDKEEIVQYTRALDGAVIYGAKLYNTVVFEVDPAGNVTFRCDDWVTPSTVQFMNLVMSDLGVLTGKLFGYAMRRFKGIWVRPKPLWDKEAVHHLVPIHGALTFNYHLDSDKHTAPLTKVTKKTVNRIRIKEIRNKIKPFRDYCRTLLTMSDGFISAGLYKEHGLMEKNNFGGSDLRVKGVRFNFSSGTVRELLTRSYGGSDVRLECIAYELLMEQDEAVFLPLLLFLSRMVTPERAVANEIFTDDEGRTVLAMSLVVRPQAIDSLIDRIIKRYDDSVWDTEEVYVTEPTKSYD